MVRSILDRISAPGEDDLPPALCIYGPTGVGKTTLLRTLRGKGLVIDTPDVEGGTSVLKGEYPRIKKARVERWKDVTDLYHELRKGGLVGKFDWIAHDTLTAENHLARRKVLRERETIVEQPYTVRLKDYGGFGQLVIDMIHMYRKLPVMNIFLAQHRDRTDDEGVRLVRPQVTPIGIMEALLEPMHLVGFYFMAQNEDGKWERRLRVGPHPDYVTKFRALPKQPLPDVILRPHLGNIVDYLIGREGAKKPKAAKDDDALIDLD